VRIIHYSEGKKFFGLPFSFAGGLLYNRFFFGHPKSVPPI
jgi:hypothetical protein